MIPLHDNIYNRQRDVFFYVDIIFNTKRIARSTVTIVDDEYGEFTIGAVTSSTNVLLGHTHMHEVSKHSPILHVCIARVEVLM